MNTQVKILPWRATAKRPLAPSLERLRLQSYVVLLAGDILIISLSFLFAGYVRSGMLLATAVQQAMLLIPLYAVLALYNRTYSARSLTSMSFAIARVAEALAIATALLLFITFYTKVTGDFSRIAFTIGTTLSFALMGVWRFTSTAYIRSNWGPLAQNLLVIDDNGPRVSVPHAYVVKAKDHQLDCDGADPSALDRLGRCFANMDRVIVSCPMEKREHWAFFLRAAGVDGEVVTEVGQRLGAIGLRQHDDFTSMIVSARPLGIGNRVVKRIIDVVISGLALLALLPLMLLVAAAIKLEDGGPVFFVQRRMGRGNRFFGMYKFRSMRSEEGDLDGAQSVSRGDKRITRVGLLIRRTSIDELPQLLNVLRGDMSLVGPRPHALGSQAGDKLFWEVDVRYWHRHSLRPGLTGLAQIRGFRGATEKESDLADRLQSDLDYIANWTPWRDLYILALTVRVVIHKNAF